MTWTFYIFFNLLCFLQALLIYIKTNVLVSYFNFWVKTTITSILFQKWEILGIKVLQGFECWKKKTLNILLDYNDVIYETKKDFKS
jgi:hypothetical protein